MTPPSCTKTSKLVLEKNEITKEIIDEVYMDEPVEKDKDLWKVLSWLDNFTILDSSHTQRALEFYRGFTDSFGIVTGFMEAKVGSDERDGYAVGLSEQEAKSLLKHRQKVVAGDKTITLEEGKLRGLLKAQSLSLELESEGFDGIALEDFDPEIGYVHLEVPS